MSTNNSDLMPSIGGDDEPSNEVSKPQLCDKIKNGLMVILVATILVLIVFLIYCYGWPWLKKQIWPVKATVSSTTTDTVSSTTTDTTTSTTTDTTTTSTTSTTSTTTTDTTTTDTTTSTTSTGSRFTNRTVSKHPFSKKVESMHSDKKYPFGHLNKDTLNEGQLEGFLNVRSGADSIYDFTDPMKEPHNQILEGPNDMGYDPSLFSLDKDVIDSHREFVQESYLSGPGAGASVGLQTNTHLTAPNKWWGLRRVDYTTAFSKDDARTVSSEYPDQISREVGTYTI